MPHIVLFVLRWQWNTTSMFTPPSYRNTAFFLHLFYTCIFLHLWGWFNCINRFYMPVMLRIMFCITIYINGLVKISHLIRMYVRIRERLWPNDGFHRVWICSWLFLNSKWIWIHLPVELEVCCSDKILAHGIHLRHAYNWLAIDVIQIVN